MKHLNIFKLWDTKGKSYRRVDTNRQLCLVFSQMSFAY